MKSFKEHLWGVHELVLPYLYLCTSSNVHIYNISISILYMFINFVSPYRKLTTAVLMFVQ